MSKKNQTLTIGQFAALHGINKKTLMWYDEIGLFWPASINPENGYRCYNYHQSPSLLNGNFDDYSKLFIEIPLLTYQKGLHMSPGGKYLRAFHKGDLDRMPKRYEEILSFAEKHNLTPHGFSYEMGMNENVIDRIEDYIAQIEIPVLE